jgi:hypothetical protein
VLAFAFIPSSCIVYGVQVQRNNVHLVKGGKHQAVDMDCRSRRDDEKFRSTSTLYMHLNGSPPIITVDIPFLKAGLPVVAVFRLLGLHERDAIDAVLWDTGARDADGAARRMFTANYAHPLMSVPMDAVLDAAGVGLHVGADAPPEKVRRQVQQQVAGEFLPHVGFDDAPVTRVKKLAYLAIIIRRMLDVYLGRADPDDRDFEGKLRRLEPLYNHGRLPTDGVQLDVCHMRGAKTFGNVDGQLGCFRVLLQQGCQHGEQLGRSHRCSWHCVLRVMRFGQYTQGAGTCPCPHHTLPSCNALSVCRLQVRPDDSGRALCHVSPAVCCHHEDAAQPHLRPLQEGQAHGH